MRKVAQTTMTSGKNEWHQPVEQPSCVDKQGDELMVPVPQQGPPTKKVAVQGVPIPSGQREVQNPGIGDCLFHAVSQGLLQCAMKTTHVDAKEATRI